MSFPESVISKKDGVDSRVDSSMATGPIPFTVHEAGALVVAVNE